MSTSFTGQAPAPLVSIILPFLDAAATLDEALNSVRSQSLRTFELLGIDDGSVDESAAIFQAHARDDARLRYIKNPHPGLVGALNTGLLQARTDFVARMDADDLMRSARLARQYDYLRANPDIAVLGTQVALFPQEAIHAGYREYIRWQNACLSSGDIRNAIYVESPFAHPSVMFRRTAVAAVSDYHDGDFPEDYDLWLRLNASGARMAKLDSVLLDWRDSARRYSRISPHCSREAFDRLRAHYLAIDQRLHQGRPLAYWGAGRKTRKRARLLQEQGFPPDVWIDIDPRKIGNRLAGVPVVAPAWLADKTGHFVLSYVTNHGAQALIAEQLEAMDYQCGRDYLMVG